MGLLYGPKTNSNDKWQQSLDLTPSDQVKTLSISTPHWRAPKRAKQLFAALQLCFGLDDRGARRSLVAANRTSVPWPWFNFVDLVSWHKIQWLLSFVTYPYTCPATVNNPHLCHWQWSPPLLWLRLCTTSTHQDHYPGWWCRRCLDHLAELCLPDQWRWP